MYIHFPGCFMFVGRNKCLSQRKVMSAYMWEVEECFVSALHDSRRMTKAIKQRALLSPKV